MSLHLSECAVLEICRRYAAPGIPESVLVLVVPEVIKGPEEEFDNIDGKAPLGEVAAVPLGICDATVELLRDDAPGDGEEPRYAGKGGNGGGGRIVNGDQTCP